MIHWITLKSDAKFTTRAQIVKLQTGHEIEKISLKINDAKRSKQLRSVTIYYTTRTSIPIIELKNCQWFWLKAKIRTVFWSLNQLSYIFSVKPSYSFDYWYPPEPPEPLLWLDFEALSFKKYKCLRLNYFSVIVIKDRLNFMDDYI